MYAEREECEWDGSSRDFTVVWRHIRNSRDWEQTGGFQ